MPASDPSPVSADESPGISPATDKPRPGIWPGLAPLEIGDSERFYGHGRELERLVRLFKRPASGRTPLVWLTGDAGAGKTSLVLAGLLPRLRKDAGEAIEWIRIIPEPGTGPKEMIDAIVTAILKRSDSEDEDTGLGLGGRLRQIGLLMDQDAAEAIEYLASCHCRNSGGAPELASQKKSNCLIFIDQWDRMMDFIESASSKDEPERRSELLSLVSFLNELSLAGCFPCLVALRSLNFPAIRSAAAGAGCEGLGSEISIGPLDFETVRKFFESAPSAGTESGRVFVKPEVLDFLVSDAGGKKNTGNGAVPFVSESLKRWAASEPLADEIGLEYVRWSGGVGQVFAEVAESVVSWLPARRKCFFALMAALHPAESYLGGNREELKTDSTSVSYHGLTGDPEVRRLVNALIDTRVLCLEGSSLEKARVSWTVPNAILKWNRALTWLEENDRLIARSREFDRARENWESEQRTPVRLLHSTRSIADARELLDYHGRRRILSEELASFLEESLNFEEHLGADWRRRRWIRLALIAGGILLVVAIVVFAVTSSKRNPENAGRLQLDETANRVVAAQD